MSDVTREEFDIVCDMIDVFMCQPSFVASLPMISSSGHDVLTRYAEMRNARRVVPSGKPGQE